MMLNEHLVWAGAEQYSVEASEEAARSPASSLRGLKVKLSHHFLKKFYCHYKSKPQGSGHTKLNFTHLI